MNTIDGLGDGFRSKQIREFLDSRKVIRRILMTAVRKTGAQTGSFIFVNPNNGLLEIEASHGLSARAKKLKLKMGEGITGWVATSGRVHRVGDVRRDPKYVSIDSDIRSELAVPVEIGGNVIGIVNVDRTELNAFTAQHEEELIELASQAADWLRTAWEIESLRAKAEQLATLVNMGQMIVSQQALDGILQQITRQADRLMKTKLCSLMLCSDDGQELVLRASHGAGERYRAKPNLRIADCLVGVVVSRRKPLSVLNVREHQKYQHIEIAGRERLVSLLAVPLIFADTVVGVLAVYTRQPHRFSNDEIKMLQALADLSAVAIEKGRLLAHVVEIEDTLRASERLSALGLLAAEIAHEIRNPLTVMQMLFHALVEAVPLDETTKRDAEIISEKMNQMNRIVDQVLTFAHNSEPAKEIIDPNQMLDDIFLLTRHKLSQQQIDIRYSVAPDLPALHADRSQIEQALLNLILNAADAMPDGGILRLTAGAEMLEGAQHVVLTIKDTGQGMTQDQLSKIFAPFLTFKKHGTGIGLAIIRKIVENHQGRVEIESKVGKGTVFRLIFPAA